MSRGIDYSLGRANVDRENGIHYGVISHHAVGEAWYEESSAEYGSPSCPECGREFPDDDSNEYICPQHGVNKWSDCLPDEPLAFTYHQDGYEITQSADDTDLFVTKSPYYTFAAFCSPCAPGAGHLESPTLDGVPTYALGPDWFDDGVAPYPLWDVATRTPLPDPIKTR